MRDRRLAFLGASASAVVIVSLVSVRVPAQAAKTIPARAACAGLTKVTSEGNTTITSATTVDAGTFVTPAGQTLTGLPAFCRVVGVSRPTSDSTINFEVWMPSSSWNGKFLSSGEGGFAGTINYTRSGLDGGLDELVRRGYATASTDRSEEHTSELQSLRHLVCRLLLE